MSPKQALAMVLAATAAVAGCNLNRNALKQGTETVFGQIGGSAGKVIEPKRCHVTVMILPRPLNDNVVNGAIWEIADEQAVPADVRRSLEANGLRVGVLTGGLPAEVEAAIQAPPPNRVDPAEFNLPDGSNTLITLAEPSPTASLLLNRDGRAFGKDYRDASGWFRVTADQDGPAGVALRFVPEIHHGPVLRRYDAVPNNSGTFTGMPYMLKEGQEEETLRELAATVILQPGQVAVVGCLPDRPGSLGSFLFTRAEPNSDRLVQKVLLVWGNRSNMGTPGSQTTPETKLEAVEPPEFPDFLKKDRDEAVGPARAEAPARPAKIDDAVTPAVHGR